MTPTSRGARRCSCGRSPPETARGRSRAAEASTPIGRRRGDEIRYQRDNGSTDRWLMSSRVTPTPTAISAAPPVELAKLPSGLQLSAFHPDGQRMLALRPVAPEYAGDRVIEIVNWLDQVQAEGIREVEVRRALFIAMAWSAFGVGASRLPSRPQRHRRDRRLPPAARNALPRAARGLRSEGGGIRRSRSGLTPLGVAQSPTSRRTSRSPPGRWDALLASPLRRAPRKRPACSPRISI